MARVPKLGQKLLAEFLGTYVLVTTWSCNLLGGNWLGAVSVAASLMVMIYALGPVSGGNFNPAVSTALWCADCFFGHGEMPAIQAVTYMIAQLIAGVAGSFTAAGLWSSKAGEMSNVATATQFFVVDKWPLSGGLSHPAKYFGPAPGYNLFDVFFTEMIYTGVLAFVVLNVATCRDEGRFMKNHYFGLAISFVVIAAACAIGGISGCSLNPAVSIGASFASMAFADDVNGWEQFGIFWVYLAGEILGAILATICFYGCRKDAINLEEEEEVAEAQGFVLLYQISMVSRFLAEFFGTFVLVLTVLLVIAGQARIGVLGIAAALMVMVYSLGAVSGANFNPAVSLGLLLTRMLPPKEFGVHLAAQVLAMFAAIGVATCIVREWKTALVIRHARVHETAVVGGSLGADLGSEVFYTFVLVFVVLNVVADMPNQYYGLAIGFVIVAAGIAVGPLSGGAFNPVVALAIDFGGLIHRVDGIQYGWSWLYAFIELVAGAIAAGFFCAIRGPPAKQPRKQEYEHGDESSE